MNCSTARKLLYAFADGQLGVKDNCEVLDHLKMCPECSRIVDEHQALRAVIGAAIRDAKVPAGLHERVAAACFGQAAPPAQRSYWRRLYVQGSAIAACLMFAAGLFLWKAASPEANSDRSNDSVTVPRGNSAASSIAKVHNICCDHAAKHHSKDLPKKLEEVGPAICAHYNNRIAALAPDLNSFGYRFESANFCGVRDKPGSEGGHILYVAGSGNGRLSFFSVPRWDCLDKCGNRGIRNHEGFRQYEVDQDDGSKLSILAWHNDATTYICCGAEPMQSLLPMVKEIRTAMVIFDRDRRLALAGP